MPVVAIFIAYSNRRKILSDKDLSFFISLKICLLLGPWSMKEELSAI